MIQIKIQLCLKIGFSLAGFSWSSKLVKQLTSAKTLWSTQII